MKIPAPARGAGTRISPFSTQPPGFAPARRVVTTGAGGGAPVLSNWTPAPAVGAGPGGTAPGGGGGGAPSPSTPRGLARAPPASPSLSLRSLIATALVEASFIRVKRRIGETGRASLS